MARSLYSEGDAHKDVLQGFVPGRYVESTSYWHCVLH